MELSKIRTRNTKTVHKRNKSINSKSIVLQDKESSRSLNQLLEEKSPIIIPIKQKDDSIINLSCQAIFYYLKEKGIISKPKIFLLSFIIYLCLISLYSTHFCFILISRPLYSSYLYECYSPETRTIQSCTSTNVCFCEDPGRCVTIIYRSQIETERFSDYNFGNLAQINSLDDKNKFRFGMISNYIIYDINPQNPGRIEKTNIYYKKKYKFCLLLYLYFYNILAYCLGGIIFEFILGYLSDKYGKYAIIRILSSFLLIINVFYFLIFLNLEIFNEYNSSLLIWIILSFCMGSCVNPLKNLIKSYFLEMWPEKEELFNINGILHSSFSFAFLLNYIFLTVFRQAAYFFMFNIVLITVFIYFFFRFFEENPRYFSEHRLKKEKQMNKELKKLAFLQILDIENLKTKMKEEAFIFDKQEINKNIENIKHSNKPFNKSISLNKSGAQGNNKINFFSQNLNPELHNKIFKRRFGDKTVEINLPSVNDTEDLIKDRFDSNQYIKKYIRSYMFVKLCIVVCFNSTNYYLMNNINNLNLNPVYRNEYFVFCLFSLSIIVQIFIGKVAFFVNSRTIIMLSLTVYIFLSIFIDTSMIYSSTQKNIYFGDQFVFIPKNSHHISRIIKSLLISVIYSLFEISVISFPPTLYRGLVMSQINSISSIAHVISYIGIHLIDLWSINEAVIAFIILVFYFTILNDENPQILESGDEIYLSFIKKYNKKNNLSKIELVDDNQK